MYPYKIITFPDGTGITLYEIFILLGVIAALVLFRVLADRREMPAKLQNIILIGAVVSFVAGYGCAVLFQAFYNALATGEFVLDQSTGSTFYGGFIGGAICMLLIYFIGGRIAFKTWETPLRWIPVFVNIAAACVPLAHGFGRIGCLTAGCCHGGLTDSWIGMEQYVEISPGQYGWAKVVPIQLFEALFLFGLAAVIIVLFLKKKNCGLSVYLIGYGVWRFIVEFFRTDDRGASFIPGLTPSQTTAIFLVAVGILIAVLAPYLRKKFTVPPKEAEEGGDNDRERSE